MALEIAGAGKRENTRLSQKKKRELVWRVRQRMANASASRTGTVQMDRISPEVASLYGAWHAQGQKKTGMHDEKHHERAQALHPRG